MPPLLTIKFESIDQLRGWTRAAQDLGALPNDQGVRVADAVDPPVGAKRDGEYVLTAHPNEHGWLVAPVGDAGGLEAPDLVFSEEHGEDGYDCPRCDAWIPAVRQHCPDCELDTETLT